ncbi:hypothetical protein A6770_20775 [Nostoc minutum NIES-26]|uniref:Uncharacterized protein n=1 Tax=Nostoc minutum NIES-26 TaxID=1844469 RepID=A0A367R447_9NOSO|nr:hypothetical protein A6770_20775 [Nostoc minutum NIES-26]
MGQNTKLHKTQVNLEMHSVNLTDKPAKMVNDINYKNSISTNIVLNVQGQIVFLLKHKYTDSSQICSKF